MENDVYQYVPLFETKKVRGSFIYKLYATSVFVGIVLVCLYRTTCFHQHGGPVWIGMFAAEIWFGFYWLLTQAHRWNRVYRRTFKDRLSRRYEEDLPGVDIFVCTADPQLEPPMMVINTILSVMAYEYPPEKLSVYLSDDAGSELTFYALLEASRFAQHWIPYCKRFRVEPRSPEAHFREESGKLEGDQAQCLHSIKNLYRSMEERIELARKLGSVSKNAVMEHKGFAKWESFVSKRDHDTILQILIDGRDEDANDVDGGRLPTLVYLAREKRPQHFHNFKAGAMNALIRVSSEISCGPVILNVDCDMYSNNSQSVRDALCFLLDEEQGGELAFVQFPQNFYNLTKNELYGGSLRVIYEVEFHGLDGYGGPMYIGTGCFHRRDILCGRRFVKNSTFQWKGSRVHKNADSVAELEERIKEVASCTFEKNTQWGNEVGLSYGCLVEDVLTGLSIKSRGWKSVYFNPERKGFLGVAAGTLDQTLVQHKRWSEGDTQIMLSKYDLIWQSIGKISFRLLMAYFVYFLWACNCFATIYYSLIPSLYLLKGVPLLPQVSSMWFLPFAYVVTAEHVYSFCEYLWAGGTPLGWWNEQRMWLYKRTTSYLFAMIDTLLWMVGYSESGFIVSAKVLDEDSMQRYKQEIMEFGASTPMFTILSSLAMINLFCLIGTAMKAIRTRAESGYQTMVGQIVLCGVLILINLPLYNAALFRKDNGRLPSSVRLKSVVVALLLCASYVLL